MTTNEKLFLLRNKMLSMGIDAYIIPSSDPHMSEYTAGHWKSREYISGFSGSAGTVVILADEAGLWTDSRYYLQAENELAESGITLFKAAEPDTPDYADWIAERLNPGSTLAFDGEVFSIEDARKLSRKYKHYGIGINPSLNLLDDIWIDRPPIPDNSIFVHDKKYAGADRNEKIEDIRKKMRRQDASHYLITALDEIAWTLNLRGSDVSYNPVFHAYLIISLDGVYLFIDTFKITTDIGKELARDDISVHLYTDIFNWINDMPHESGLLYDPSTTNAKISAQIPSEVIRIEKASIVKDLKGVKNPTEQNGFKSAMLKDGVAMVKFLYWLQQNVPSGVVSELSAAKQLKKFRAENENYKGESFAPISSFGAHGAIVHYNVSKQNDIPLTSDNFYLIDSGGQYLEGTTDITRTIHLGRPSEKQREDFTLVLKGHIALASTCFPEGTRGVHLDTLARKPLWSKGLNYGHGTGHGVGCFLNVHEGPQDIRPRDNGVALKIGMITSNEPGLYRAGEYGIRIENLLLVSESHSTEFGDFFKFQTLTLCPIDLKAIESSLLTYEEKKWLNNYHRSVFEKLSPLLSTELKDWLKEQTKAID
ncbi:Xaa-Pro aminopeptidase [Saccharicrinis carchari]|uniref:Xaa-Pro aminopeptidase n=1 Tax=Saccharicrinis carchari TaxID=1168039 RepID=A0A521APU8_SACCC|nr:aminopeptidase P family protein [Saccharicrinis carchari]SMO36853.1 Xaa-Pro aminopeptidase [Saccharicrinis carchari]